MSDPLSVTASVIAVLQLAATATELLRAIKHGSADRMRLRDELRSAVCLLEMLKDRIEDSDDVLDTGEALKPTSIKSLAGSDGPLYLFKRVLEDIIAKLAPQDRLRKLARPFTWPFDKNDIVEMLASLERLKSHCSLVMQNNLVELAKLSNLKLDGVTQKLESSEATSRDEKARNIILWISTISFRARHIDVLGSVKSGTGTWLLKHETFCKWVEGDINVLWCPGIPGAGKTRLVSLLVDNFERENTSPDTICAFIYCDYKRREEQTTTNLLSSLLQQVLQRSAAGALPAEISSLYDLHKMYDTRPTLAQIMDILQKLAARFKAFHVVIDALDECAESEKDALHFVSTVRSLGPQVKVLCTSRFSNAFEDYFAGSEKIEISAQSSDIRMFLDSKIQQEDMLSRHVRADPRLKEDIIQSIIDESQGMFLLASLHLASLSTKINRKGVRASLRTLPTTLDATYSDALQRIHGQATEAVDLAESVLFWIVCARRPLTVLELQHMYATRTLPEGMALENDDLPDGDIVKGVCGGLIMVDGESQTVRLVHYTTQQYFERSHGQRITDSRLSIANVSLAYLTLPNFSSGVCTTDATMSQRLEQYPFLKYAAKYWGSDLGKLGISPFPSALQTFASNSTAVEVASQAWSLHAIRYANWSQEFPKGVPALVLAAAFDLPEILRRMISDGHDVEGKGSDGETALIRAAALGHTENVRVLLELGAAVNARDHMDETALHRAARNGEEGVVRVLLGGAADVNKKSSSDWTALMSAVSASKLEMVRMLAQAGADLAAETVWGDSALSIATRSGQEAIANFLADKGAILPRGRAGRRASIVASRRGYQQLVRRLTADYEAVAGRPLERQSSILMGGLAEIQEAAEPTAVTATGQADSLLPSTSEFEIDHGDFLDIIDGLDYSMGFSRRYNQVEKLGKGHFAEVFLCSSKVTGAVYAVKVFRLDRWKGPTRLDKWEGPVSLMKTVRRECHAMRENPHVNVLRFVDLFTEYMERTVYMVLEFAAGGDLFNLVVRKQKLTETETRRVFSQLFSALDFLHDRGWIHRDIKPENLLLSDEESLTLKLADFGLAKNIRTDSGEWAFATSLCGTPSYVAPEVLVNAPASRSVGMPVDVWSCGVVLYICLCGFPPFSDELFSNDFPYSLSQQIKQGRFDYPSPYWDPIGDPALDLIDSMLIVDTGKRFTIKQCISHAWTLDPMLQMLRDIIRSTSPEPL